MSSSSYIRYWFEIFRFIRSLATIPVLRGPVIALFVDSMRSANLTLDWLRMNEVNNQQFLNAAWAIFRYSKLGWCRSGRCHSTPGRSGMRLADVVQRVSNLRISLLFQRYGSSGLTGLRNTSRLVISIASRVSIPVLNSQNYTKRNGCLWITI